MLRHGGASHDALLGTRSEREIQERGRWASERNVRRYRKGGRVNQLLAGLAPAIRAEVEAADARVSAWA
eukprot:1107894-Lingulodinium_polyedra.AAC.1